MKPFFLICIASMSINFTKFIWLSETNTQYATPHKEQLRFLFCLLASPLPRQARRIANNNSL